MAKADRRVSFILPGPLLSLDTRSERHDRGGTIRGRGDQVWLRYSVRGDHLFYHGRSGGTDFEGGPILRGDHPQRDKTLMKFHGSALGSSYSPDPSFPRLSRPAHTGRVWEPNYDRAVPDEES